MTEFTYDTTCTGGAWTYWDSSYTCSATTTTDIVWVSWCSDSVSYKVVASESNEVKAAREAKAKRQREIDAKAEQWLKSHLSPEQQEQYEKTHKFTVISRDGQRRYEITKENAWVYELNEKGQRIRSFCIHSRITLPKADEICAKKVLLESDEKAFLKIANATRLAA